MSTSYESQKVKCPFYKKDDKNTISCEGTEMAQTLTLRFGSGTQKSCKMEKYCNQKYESCEIYKAIMKKYNA